jgi:eukaryotic-like serine/threonine-protein kinase
VTEYVLDGRYALVERIASGGMGEVWRGTDQMLGRPIAIKLLSAAHASDEQFRARFRAEARYAASLSHPGIARVFDYGETSPLGGPYLVMELVNGEPLSAILEREGRLPPDVTMDIVAQAARALHVAHQAGIVHRDIKPGNLLITADGTTKITDFGIAKAQEAQSVNLTATGIVMGTALYVSPEQATGQTVTGASDIYSLGVVAYECLAGQPPFVAEQPLAIAIMHKHDPVPPLPADVPRPVADLVLAMLAKDPADRPDSARHVADRAEVIRDGRATAGGRGPITADLPVVPNYPLAAETVLDYPDYSDYPERTRGFPLGNRRLAAAGVGVALCGVVAIVAVLLAGANGHRAASTGSPPPPRGVSHVVSPATASVTPSTATAPSTGTNLGTVPQTTPAHSPSTTPSHRQSPTPTHHPTSPTTTASGTPTTTSSSSPSASASASASATSTGTGKATPPPGNQSGGG